MGAAAQQEQPFAALRRVTGSALGTRRIAWGFVTALAGGPLLTWLLLALRNPESITYEVLSYQLLVVIVALIGGLRPAVFAAVLSGITLDLLFVAPQFSITVEHPLHLVVLVLYVVIAVLVSVIVDQAARRARAARRATDEAELLVSVAGHVLRGDSAALALVSRTREALALAGVRLVDRTGHVIASDGEPLPDSDPTELPVAGPTDGRARATLEVHGPVSDARSRRLLGVVVAQLAAVLEHTELSDAARTAANLAETDQVRTALLSALSHDLRRPLASAVAAVGGLRTVHGLSASDREELVTTADESLRTLSKLITDLLDASRIQAGVLAVSAARVDAADSILAALDELSLGPAAIDLDLDAELSALHADPVLLQRVLVNLLANAFRHSPAGSHVRVSAQNTHERVEIRIADHGAGVPADRREAMFQPFQRLGDTDNTAGLGLGLALSRGFTEGMGGTLRPEETPGGGLTMVISLPVAPPSATERSGS